MSHAVGWAWQTSTWKQWDCQDPESPVGPGEYRLSTVPRRRSFCVAHCDRVEDFEVAIIKLFSEERFGQPLGIGRPIEPRDYSLGCITPLLVLVSKLHPVLEQHLAHQVNPLEPISSYVVVLPLG